MEIEDLSEEEIQDFLVDAGDQIAMALGIDDIEVSVSSAYGMFFQTPFVNPMDPLETLELQFGVLRPRGEFDFIDIGGVYVGRKPDCREGWFVHKSNSPRIGLIVYILGRLGIEDGYVFEQLEEGLSAHERLELRLNHSREFWPQKWLDEEAS